MIPPLYVSEAKLKEIMHSIVDVTFTRHNQSCTRRIEDRWLPKLPRVCCALYHVYKTVWWVGLKGKGGLVAGGGSGGGGGGGGGKQAVGGLVLRISVRVPEVVVVMEVVVVGGNRPVEAGVKEGCLGRLWEEELKDGSY